MFIIVMSLAAKVDNLTSSPLMIDVSTECYLPQKMVSPKKKQTRKNKIQKTAEGADSSEHQECFTRKENDRNPTRMSHPRSVALDDETSIEPSTSKQPNGEDYAVQHVDVTSIVPSTGEQPSGEENPVQHIVSLAEVSPDESFRSVAGTTDEVSPQPAMAANAPATIPRAQALRRRTVFVYGAMESEHTTPEASHQADCDLITKVIQHQLTGDTTCEVWKIARIGTQKTTGTQATPRPRPIKVIFKDDKSASSFLTHRSELREAFPTLDFRPEFSPQERINWRIKLAAKRKRVWDKPLIVSPKALAQGCPPSQS